MDIVELSKTYVSEQQWRVAIHADASVVGIEFANIEKYNSKGQDRLVLSLFKDEDEDDEDEDDEDDDDDENEEGEDDEDD
jgi:hypothetical protein